MGDLIDLNKYLQPKNALAAVPREILQEAIARAITRVSDMVLNMVLNIATEGTFEGSTEAAAAMRDLKGLLDVLYGETK
jgi:hypothetical protein